jgi:hypothetical protein
MASIGSQATEFITLLVEYGGVYKVDKRTGFVLESDDAEVGIVINEKKLPLMVQREVMPPGAFAILNPFNEPMGVSTERVWFLQSRSAILSEIMKRCFIALAELANSENSSEYAKMEHIGRFAANMDAKFIKEITKLKSSRLLRIFYSKAQRTAQLQTDMFDPDFVKELDMRARSIATIQGLLCALLKVDEKDTKNGIDQVYKYSSPEENVGVQETDCYIVMMIKFAEVMNDLTKLLIDTDLKPDQLKEHYPNLLKYKKALAWCASATSSKKEIKDLAPWMPGAVGMPTSPMITPSIGGQMPFQLPGMVQPFGTFAAKTSIQPSEALFAPRPQINIVPTIPGFGAQPYQQRAVAPGEGSRKLPAPGILRR